MDVATARCATEPVSSRAGQATVDALWASWRRLGLPAAVQADNEWAFSGSPAHPRALGPLIRLCLPHGIEPWVIPPREPWWNGVVEKFNDHYRSKFLARVEVPTFAALGPASRAFEAKHNSRYRYTKLGGQTPLLALQREKRPLRFPSRARPPRVPLPKPQAGRYHLVRFIRSDRRLDVFGERPPPAGGRVRIRGRHRRRGGPTLARGARGRSRGRVCLRPPLTGRFRRETPRCVTDQVAHRGVTNPMALVK